MCTYYLLVEAKGKASPWFGTGVLEEKKRGQVKTHPDNAYLRNHLVRDKDILKTNARGFSTIKRNL